MHVAFIDIAAAYDAATPETQALGGTQAAACHLAAELAKAGTGVTLINQSRAAGEKLGVRHLPPEALDDPASLKNFSHLVLNGRWTPKLLRGLKERTEAPLIGWMHEACFQTPYVEPCPEFSGLVFVSRWQQKLNAPLTPPRAKSAVIGHGVAPYFHDVSPHKETREALTAVYAGSSKRGLFFLPAILPALHEAFPALRFEIYSDGVMGQDPAQNEALRRQFDSVPGLVHFGAAGQKELARRFAGAGILLSPNTYPESFCICLAEAMRAGLLCIATARAALPETAGGFASLMPVAAPDDPGWLPQGLEPAAFAVHATSVIKGWLRLPPEEREARRAAQTAYAQTQFNWSKRAKDWTAFLAGIAG